MYGAQKRIPIGFPGATLDPELEFQRPRPVQFPGCPPGKGQHPVINDHRDSGDATLLGRIGHTHRHERPELSVARNPGDAVMIGLDKGQ